MKILITGGAGYLGTVITQSLLEEGHQVRCLDRVFFGEEKIKDFLSNPSYELFKDDIRTFDKNHLAGVDVVIDLAALSNDPLGNLVGDKMLDINCRGRLRVCRLAKEMGVKRYILASSCSVYGFNAALCDESSVTNPVSLYAKASLQAEEVLREVDEHFSVTVLRLATAFGVSRRMRFDLAINLMTLKAFKDSSIDVLGQGMQWRPFVHVQDIARLVSLVVTSDIRKISGQIFNIGHEENNIRIINLACLVRELLPFDVKVRVVPDDPDRRSYKVSFSKMKDVLGFQPQGTIEQGIREVYGALKRGDIWDSMDTETVRWYQHLIAAEALMKQVVLNGRLL